MQLEQLIILKYFPSTRCSKHMIRIYFWRCSLEKSLDWKKPKYLTFTRSNQSQAAINWSMQIWSYRCKWHPDGCLLHHKSRICADGSRQCYGIDYWQSFASVVQWSKFFLCLTLSMMLGLESRQVDFTHAFLQADIGDDVYLHIPRGFYVNQSGQVVQHADPTFSDKANYIKLAKNLYGCKQAARN